MTRQRSLVVYTITYKGTYCEYCQRWVVRARCGNQWYNSVRRRLLWAIHTRTAAHRAARPTV